MFTQKFKLLVLAIGAILILFAIVFNQILLSNQVKQLVNRPVIIREVILTPTASPSASPTPVKIVKKK